MISDTWIEAAAPQVGGCPLITMQQEWLNTAREFFIRSTCWRETLSVIPIAAQTDIYQVASARVNVDVNYIHQVSIPDRYLAPSSHHPVVLANQDSETPTQYSCPEPDTLRLWPMPTVDIAEMTVVVSLVPSSYDDADMPAYLLTQYFGPLLDGMLGRMMNYKNKPYSNAEGAQYHLRRFRSGMARVRANTIHGLNESENNWAYPTGFARGRMYL